MNGVSESPDTLGVVQPAGVQPSTILFLAADPSHMRQLELGEEYRTIDEEIRKARFRDQVRLQSRWAARPDDLLGALNAEVPRVLHFSGHGSGAQGLCFQSDDGSVAAVSAEALKQVMEAAGATVQIVVLNACYSKVQAEAIVAHIPCVVGMTDAIGDKAAIRYAAALYSALTYGQPLAAAHKQGLAALALHASAGRTRDINAIEDAVRPPIPTLVNRKDVDPSQVFLVRPERPAPPPPPPWPLAKIVLGLACAAALLVLALGAYLWYDEPDHPIVIPGPGSEHPLPDPRFAVTVQLVSFDAHGDPPCQGGSVSLAIGSPPITRQVSRAGDVRFTELSSSLKDSRVSVAVACGDQEIAPGFDRITLTPEGTYSVVLRARCGNGRCDPGETHASCPKDCADATVAVERSGPCTRVDGMDIRPVRTSCPPIGSSDPDRKAIAEHEQANGYKCTEVFDCTKSRTASPR